MRSKLTLLWILLILSGCGRGPLAPESVAPRVEEAEKGPAGDCGGLAVPVPDPIQRSEYSGAVEIPYVVDESGEYYKSGVVFLPQESRSNPATGPFPLVLILHATGYHYRDYLNTQAFLAENGFASASMDWGPASYPEKWVDRMLEHLDYLYGAFAYSDRLANNIAMVGHSRGGKAVVRHAKDIQSAGYDVNGVVALAPAPQNYQDMAPLPSKSLLVMLARYDDDPAANGANKIPAGYFEGVEYSGFFTYDNAGHFANEWNDYHPAIDFRKMMVYLSEGPHQTFACSKQQNNPTPAKHQEFVRGYLNAYLRYALRGQAENLVFFADKQEPASLDPSLELMVQYSSNQRSVVANFSGQILDINQAGGANVFEGVVVEQGIAPQIIDLSRHATGTLSLEWNNGRRPIDASARFTIPASTPWGDNPRDQSGMRYLSLRVGTVSASPLNDPGVEPIFGVRLHGPGGVVSQTVSLAGYGGVPHWTNDRPSMHTVRIKLCHFDDVDPADIRAVELVFGTVGPTRGAVQIDNLEFCR